MAKNSVRTSPKMASKAGKALGNSNAGKLVKQLAGATLSNRRPK